VIGIDFATQMLEIADSRVRAAGAENVDVRTGDMTALDIEPGSVDVVLCVLGVFFVDDMPGLLRSFWSLLRPGGRMAITVLGERFFDPMIDVFLDAVEAERPGFDVVQPWRRIGDPAAFRALAEEAGLSGFTLREDTDILTLESPDDWWRIVIGSGLRRTAEALGEETAERVRARCGEAMQALGVTQVDLTSQYLLATHP